MRPAGLAMLFVLCILVAPAVADTDWLGAKPKRPDRMTAIWTDTVLNQHGKIGVRGFGGRVMFFSQAKTKSAKVEGTLTVFAYDDTDGDATKTVPERKFIFSAENLHQHYSKSALGHSYSFWIPWGPVTGDRRIISLVCRFEPTGGAMIVSDTVRQILPGKNPASKDTHPELAGGANSASQVAEPNGAGVPGTIPSQLTTGLSQMPAAQQTGAVQPTSYDAPIQPPAFSRSARARFQTSTINIPENYRWRNPHTPPTTRAAANSGNPSTMASDGLAETEPEWNAESGQGIESATIPSAGPDPAVVAAAAELLAKALATQAAQAGHSPPVRSASPNRTVPGSISSIGSGPAPPRAPGAAVQRPKRDRVQLRPHPAGWPNAQSSLPATASMQATATNAPPADAAELPFVPPGRTAP